ncbi:MAG: insulinase family protein [Ruthenibacterium sp.]
MNRTQLANGVHSTVLPAEKFKRCRVAVYFLWPSRRETATAEALLPLLMERSYADCPDMTELSKRLAALYGASLSVDMSTLGANRVLSVSVSGIQDAYALEGEKLSAQYAAMALGVAFRPRLVHGLFDAQDVAIEKEQLQELLESEINDKRGYCLRQARRRYYGVAPEGIERYGYLEEVEALTPAAVTNAWHSMIGTAQIEVMVLGADEAVVRESVLQALKNIDRAPTALAAPCAMPRIEPQRCTEVLDTVQGKLCLLFTAGEPVAEKDYAALRVATALLGGTPTSRLFMNVREKRSLCYYCAASGTARNGVLCIDSGVEHANAAAAREAVLEELAALQNGPMTQQELDETKRSLVCALESVEDTLSGVEGWYFSEICRDSAKSPRETIADINAVTAQEVGAALRRFSLSVEYLLTKEGSTNV